MNRSTVYLYDPPLPKQCHKDGPTVWNRAHRKCKYCIHGCSNQGYLGCNYILDTGHSRGCVGDENCDKFERGEWLCKSKAIMSLRM